MQLQSPAPIDRGPLVPVEVADRPPGPDELLVAVAACAVCRTDVQLIEGDLAARRLPIVPGHQAVGRVVALGDDVSDWSVGDRAGIGWLAGTCGVCDFCVSGRENLCAEAEFTGWDRDGGYGEAVLGRADFALRLPDGPTDRELAPLLCGGVIGYRSLVVSGIQPGQRLGLFGFGASASLAIQVARHWDCEVYVATRSESEQQRARELGAAWAGGYDDPMPQPLDAAVTFAPVGSRGRGRPRRHWLGRDRRRQRHPPRPHPAVRLQPAVAGTPDPQRRQLHPRRRRRLPVDCCRDSHRGRRSRSIRWSRPTRPSRT